MRKFFAGPLWNFMMAGLWSGLALGSAIHSNWNLFAMELCLTTLNLELAKLKTPTK